ncbi:MAG: hypothetical protein GXO90_10790 [FCB group bacterium]|nr:hypothetical protein [FCB group bacterium]
MAVTILIGNAVVLNVKPHPVGQALIIAAVSVLLEKWFVSFLHLPSIISYSIPTLSFLILSYRFFKPTVPKLFVYWMVGFAAYLVIHIPASSIFNWSDMFPFWKVHLF